MAVKNSYIEKLKQDLGLLIDKCELDDVQKHFLHSRWLDQVAWMESKASSDQRRYYLLRMATIIGGIIVPAFVSLNVGNATTSSVIRWTVFVISLLVAISGAMEGFFRYGDRWRHYRQSVEALKTEGWQFIQQVGGYPKDQFANHAAAYSKFAGRVEDLLQREVGVYVTEVVVPKKAKEQGVEDGATSQQASSTARS